MDSQEKLINMKQICRLCLIEKENFANIASEDNFREILQICTSIKVSIILK